MFTASTGFTFDKDVVVQISAADSNSARQKMFDYFGDKWGHGVHKQTGYELFPTRNKRTFVTQ